LGERHPNMFAKEGKKKSLLRQRCEAIFVFGKKKREEKKAKPEPLEKEEYY